MRANPSCSLPIRPYIEASTNHTESSKDYSDTRSLADDNVDTNRQSLGNPRQMPRLNIFDMTAFKVANVGNDSVDIGACKLTKHLKVNIELV